MKKILVSSVIVIIAIVLSLAIVNLITWGIFACFGSTYKILYGFGVWFALLILNINFKSK